MALPCRGAIECDTILLSAKMARQHMRLTHIICTLGPSSISPEMIQKLAENGMDIARINFSHGSQEGHRETIQKVKAIREKHNVPIALLLDTKGAEIRTGDVEEPIDVQKDQEVFFSYEEIKNATKPVIRVNYEKFAHDVKKAESILVENGELPFAIVSIEKNIVTARALDSGSIGSRRHINLPGADVSLPSMTDRDWSDLAMGIEEEMDFVALSFIRTAEEVEEVRAFLDKKKSTMRIITKIETRQAVADISRIIDASDGIMVARGDLGAEMPFQKIPAVQDKIVALCRAKGKPVIVATQMLESMIQNPVPTRAEVTDVAHAVLTRADAIMLSGETAKGDHPVAAVSAMRTIAEETESHQDADHEADQYCPAGERYALADAAVNMAQTVEASAILVLTRSGRTAQAVSFFRSNLPILAYTDVPQTQRILQLTHGVHATVIAFDENPETTIASALNHVQKTGMVKTGAPIVCITDTKTDAGNVLSVHLRKAL